MNMLTGKSLFEPGYGYHEHIFVYFRVMYAKFRFLKYYTDTCKVYYMYECNILILGSRNKFRPIVNIGM